MGIGLKLDFFLASVQSVGPSCTPVQVKQYQHEQPDLILESHALPFSCPLWRFTAICWYVG
eukprot:5555780-Amphidinium_carterae.2